MAQNGRVVNGQNDGNAPALPTASLFRFYTWNDRGHDTQHLHVRVRLYVGIEYVKATADKIRVVGRDPS